MEEAKREAILRLEFKKKMRTKVFEGQPKNGGARCEKEKQREIT